MEQVEIDMLPRCDDGTLKPDSPLVDWVKQILDATQQAHRPMAYNPDTRRLLEWQGFDKIQEQVIRIPLNPWPSDPYLRDVGRWYNLGLTQGLEALSVGPLTRMTGMTKDDVGRLTAIAKREICSRKVHAYCNL